MLNLQYFYKYFIRKYKQKIPDFYQLDIFLSQQWCKLHEVVQYEHIGYFRHKPGEVKNDRNIQAFGVHIDKFKFLLYMTSSLD